MNYKNKLRTKTAFQEAVTNVTNKAFNFLKHNLASVFLAVAFFTHFFFPHPEYDYKEASEKVSVFEDAISEDNEKIIELAIQLNNDQINLSEFNSAIRSTSLHIKEQQKGLKIAESKFNVIRDHKKSIYFGFTSYNKFMWTFGLALVITVLSLRIMYFSHTIEDDNRRKSNSLLGLIGGIVGGYLFAFIFYPKPDLPYEYYMIILISMGVIGSILGYYLSRAGYKSRSALKAKIRYIMNLMIVRTTKMELVKDIKVYTVEIVEPALNKLDE